MPYTPINWKNLPNQTTPINAQNLHKMDDQLVYLTDKSDELTNIRIGEDGTVYSSAGNAVRQQVKKVSDEKVNIPYDDNNSPDYGEDGQILQTKGDGSTKWVNIGTPSDEQVSDAVEEWLDEHPEATTTIEDGSITAAKLNSGFLLGVANYYVTPEMFGAAGDGIIDDTQAIIDAFNYCKLHENVSLYSSGKTYKTTDLCVLQFGSARFEVNLRGTFDYLEFIGNPSIRFGEKIFVRSATTVKVTNFKNLRFDGGIISNFYLSADTEINASGSCAYNVITGNNFPYITLNNKGNNAWINENKFIGIRCTHLTITSIDYPHNNNRFYDMTIENGSITLHNANSNYISCRAEGGYTLNSDNTAYNNIIEQTWQSREMASNNTSPKISNGSNVEIFEYFKYFSFTRELALNYKKVYHNSNDYSKGTFRLPNWTVIASIKMPADSAYMIRSLCNEKNLRASLYVLDSTGTAIEVAANDLFTGTGYTYNSETKKYERTTNAVGVSCAIHNLGDDTKTVVFDISTANQSSAATYFNVDVGHIPGVSKYWIDSPYLDGLFYASKPTNTDAPLGTYVRDSSGSTKGWVLTTQGWADV